MLVLYELIFVVRIERHWNALGVRKCWHPNNNNILASCGQSSKWSIFFFFWCFIWAHVPWLRRFEVPIRQTACPDTFFCRNRTARPKTAISSSRRPTTFPVCKKTRRWNYGRPNTPATCAVTRHSSNEEQYQ